MDSDLALELVAHEQVLQEIKQNSNVLTHQDPRRRCEALLSLEKIGEHLDFSLYPQFVEALEDDYERCRLLAIKLIITISTKYGNSLVFQKGTYEQVRLEDDAFSNVCRMITDPDVQVRTEAAKSIAEFRHVNLEYLLATLDKKSNVDHCGAFVFGLEDERKNVRHASLDSLSRISKINSSFAQKSIDHIVDMFNDEIDDVRLKAIQCLRDITNVALLDDQVEIILTALDSPSMNIREALHEMLSRVKLSSAMSLRKCVEATLLNLSRYPQDKLSIFRCFKHLGETYADRVSDLIPELLAIHPYLKLAEQSLIDDNYIATLILIFNAASHNPEVSEVLEQHNLQHRTYIRHTLPNYMPKDGVAILHNAPCLFFRDIFNRLESMLKSRCPQESKMSLMEITSNDLQNFSQVEPGFRAATQFYRDVMESMLILSKVLLNRDWLRSTQSFKHIRRVLDLTFDLLRKYHKLSAVQKCCIQQLRVNALAIELIVFVRSSNSSALDICDNFIEEVKNLESFLLGQPFLDIIALDDSSNTILGELTALENPKPGTVARKLEPLYSNIQLALSQINEILIVLMASQNIDELQMIKITSASFNNAVDYTDKILKFTAGLVLALTVDANIDYALDTENIRVKVTYPDKQSHVIVPMPNDFRLVSKDAQSGASCYRLYSQVNISHSMWTESSPISLTILLDYRDDQSTCIKAASTDRDRIIELCKPLFLKVHPQNIRW